MTTKRDVQQWLIENLPEVSGITIDDLMLELVDARVVDELSIIAEKLGRKRTVDDFYDLLAHYSTPVINYHFVGKTSHCNIVKLGKNYFQYTNFYYKSRFAKLLSAKVLSEKQLMISF